MYNESMQVVFKLLLQIETFANACMPAFSLRTHIHQQDLLKIKNCIFMHFNR